jgi:hypothetical protein
VPAAERQAAAGQVRVDAQIAEWRHPRRSLEDGEPRPHSHETRLARHAETSFVLFLF